MPLPFAAIYSHPWGFTPGRNVATCPSIWCWVGCSFNEGIGDIVTDSWRRAQTDPCSSTAERKSSRHSSCEPPRPSTQSWVIPCCTTSNGCWSASFTHTKWGWDPQQWACEWCGWTLVQPHLNSGVSVLIANLGICSLNRAGWPLNMKGFYFSFLS